MSKLDKQTDFPRYKLQTSPFQTRTPHFIAKTGESTLCGNHVTRPAACHSPPEYVSSGTAPRESLDCLLFVYDSPTIYLPQLSHPRQPQKQRQSPAPQLNSPRQESRRYCTSRQTVYPWTFKRISSFSHQRVEIPIEKRPQPHLSVDKTYLNGSPVSRPERVDPSSTNMSPLEKMVLKRKKSNVTMSSGLSRNPSLAMPDGQRSSTPGSTTSSAQRSGHRMTSSGLRHFFDKRRGREPEFEILTQSSRSVASLPPPKMTKVAQAFVNSLNSRQLSDFLTWMLYYDIVQLPSSPNDWYNAVDTMEMRGWLALGDFLSQTSNALDTGYGMDLVVLDSICDRLELQRSTVHGLLVQFATPQKMAFSTIATVVKEQGALGSNDLDSFEAVQAKLHELYKLATHLKPQEGTHYDDWHAIILKRMRGFLHLVIGPRIANFRSGTPLITASTSEQLPKEVKDGIKLAYLYEVMQEQRQVPLSHYGIHQSNTPLAPMTPPQSLPSSPPEFQSASTPDLDDTECARLHAIYLMSENRNLRARIAGLEHDKEKVEEANDKLARKVATLGRLQPVGYQLSRSKTRTSEADTSSSRLTVPQHPSGRPRSLSHNAGEKLAQQLLDAPTTQYKRQRSEVLSWKYEDVFSSLDHKPIPTIRLSDPKTGELDEPLRNAERTVSFVSNAGRRSGLVFNADQVDLVAAIRGATQEGGEEEDGEEDEEVGDVGTPTPVGRERLDFG